jgi:hypothetical protein
MTGNKSSPVVSLVPLRRTFGTHNPVLIASRAELLTSEEARNALALPVTPVNVFGEAPLPPERLSGDAAMRAFFEPSRGVVPSFGERTNARPPAAVECYGTMSAMNGF